MLDPEEPDHHADALHAKGTSAASTASSDAASRHTTNAATDAAAGVAGDGAIARKPADGEAHTTKDGDGASVAPAETDVGSEPSARSKRGWGGTNVGMSKPQGGTESVTPPPPPPRRSSSISSGREATCRHAEADTADVHDGAAAQQRAHSTAPRSGRGGGHGGDVFEAVHNDSQGGKGSQQGHEHLPGAAHGTVDQQLQHAGGHTVFHGQQHKGGDRGARERSHSQRPPAVERESQGSVGAALAPAAGQLSATEANSNLMSELAGRKTRGSGRNRSVTYDKSATEGGKSARKNDAQGTELRAATAGTEKTGRNEVDITGLSGTELLELVMQEIRRDEDVAKHNHEDVE